jgi:protein-tyrosine phosphatase
MNKIKLEGTHNTRDLGGYETQDGRVIKKGFLFRSDGLGKLTPEDCKKLSNLGIKRIVDFRSEVEKIKQPNIIPTGMEYIEMPIEADKNINNEIYDILSGKVDKDMREFLIEANKDFVLQYKEVFSDFLKDLVNSGLPTLFHCTAGKDRTGFATLLIYTILGVDMDTILVDYLKTNYFIQDSMGKQLENVAKLMNIKEEDKEKILPLLRVDIDYIESAINTANKKYGSIHNFISEGLKISLKERDLLKELMISKY